MGDIKSININDVPFTRLYVQTGTTGTIDRLNCPTKEELEEQVSRLTKEVEVLWKCVRTLISEKGA